MPIYAYKCDACFGEVEKLQPMGGEAPHCCGQRMKRMPSSPAMVKIKGCGGYPSRRKMIKGSAPYSSG